MKKKSLLHTSTTSRVIDEERRVVGVSNTSDAYNSINNVKVLPEQTYNRSVKAKQTSEELTLHFELLQENADVTAVLRHAQQGKLLQVTMFYDSYLLLQEGNKCFESDKNSKYVNEQPCALQEELNALTIYQKLCHGVVTHDRFLKSNDKSETQTMNSPF